MPAKMFSLKREKIIKLRHELIRTIGEIKRIQTFAMNQQAYASEIMRLEDKAEELAEKIENTKEDNDEV